MYSLIRRLLFLLDAEAAHELTVAQVTRLQQIPLVLRVMARLCRAPKVPRRVWDLRFDSPIGIAAGFDKNALMMPFLAALGFGFLEVGTVTLHPQPGNPRPRIFRDPERGALINRLGFNSDGANAIAERLQRWRESDSPQPPLFVNVGKNRDVPLDRSADSYAHCYLRVARWADGCVLNVSSPNTPALRDLQRPEHLEVVLRLVRSMRDQMVFPSESVHPILVKIAPDLDETQLREICDVCTRLADGLVCTNTSATEQGGVSGRPLFGPSTAILRAARAAIGGDYPLIGVGGIFTADDAREKLAAGANLVQIYTGFVYEGPGLPARLARALT
jgi:dihydroorotate dehydrogenase